MQVGEKDSDSFGDKSELRRAMLARRRARGSLEIARASRAVTKYCLDIVSDRLPLAIHCYKGLERLGEIDTTELIGELKSRFPGSRVDVASVSATALKPEVSYDLIFIPVVAFDRGGFRLGMGGGWYDAFLAEQPQAFKVGLAYEWAEVASLPTEPHDVHLDVVVTPSGIQTCSQ